MTYAPEDLERMQRNLGIDADLERENAKKIERMIKKGATYYVNVCVQKDDGEEYYITGDKLMPLKVKDINEFADFCHTSFKRFKKIEYMNVANKEETCKIEKWEWISFCDALQEKADKIQTDHGYGVYSVKTIYD